MREKKMFKTQIRTQLETIVLFTYINVEKYVQHIDGVACNFFRNSPDEFTYTYCDHNLPKSGIVIKKTEKLYKIYGHELFSKFGFDDGDKMCDILHYHYKCDIDWEKAQAALYMIVKSRFPDEKIVFYNGLHNSIFHNDQSEESRQRLTNVEATFTLGEAIEAYESI
jgi:hypothetical protein